MSGRGLYSGSRCCGMPSGKFQTIARALALPNGWQPCFSATRWMPPERSFAQVLPSASFFSASVSSSHQPSFFSSTWSNCGWPVVISRALRVRAVLGQQVDAVAARRRTARGSCRRRP